MANPQTVDIYAPDGSRGTIPFERLNDALHAGAVPAVRLQSPDGSIGTIPANRVNDALKAGGKVLPYEQQEVQHPGFWKSLGSDLWNNFGPPTSLEQVKQRALGSLGMNPTTAPISQALNHDQDQQQIQQRAAEGHGIPYQVGAQVAEKNPILPTNVAGMEQSAREGDVAGVLGHAAAPVTALAAGELAARTGPPALRAVGDVLPKDLSLRNNPATNALIGPKPEAIAADQAFIKAVRPRNSIQNVNERVNTALPDMRRAADSIGVDVGKVTLDDAPAIIARAKSDVWNEFESRFLNPNKRIGVDTTPVADRIQSLQGNYSDITKQQNPGIGEAVQGGADIYRGKTYTVEQIEQRINDLNNELRSQQSQFKVNASDLRRDPRFAPKFAELDGLRQLESDTFDNYSGPGAAMLKRRYGALKVMDDVVNRRINVADRAAPVGTMEGMGRMAGAGNVAGGAWATITGHPGEGVPMMAKGAAQVRMGQNIAKLNNPDFLLQQALSKTTPSGAPAAVPPAPVAGLLPRGPLVTPPPADASGPIPVASNLINMRAAMTGTRAQRLGLLLKEPHSPIVTPSPADTSGPIAGADNLINMRAAMNGTRAQRLGLLLKEGTQPIDNPTNERPFSDQARAELGPKAPPQAVVMRAQELKNAAQRGKAPVTSQPLDTATRPATIVRERLQYAQAKESPFAAVPEPIRASAEPARGAETSIRVPGEDRAYSAHYQIRELDDVHPSHSGITFQPNPRYSLTNDRDYGNALNQGKVIEPSGLRFDPAYHITDNPDATNGPVVIDSKGQALGGNGRAMILDRVYRFNQRGADAYKTMLQQKAAQFGIDPNVVANMKRPVLVREIDDHEFGSPDVKQTAITDFNKKGTAELTPAERAVSDSRRISAGTLDSIAGHLEKAGNDANLSSVLEGGTGKEILDKLIGDGVLTPQERAAYATADGLTPAGKERISKLVVARYFRDSAQLDSAAPSLRAKLERVAAPLAKVSGVASWDLDGIVREANDIIDEMRAHNLHAVDDVLTQGGLWGESTKYSPEAVAMAKKLRTSSALEMSRAAKAYARDALDSTRGLLGGQVSQKQAFREAFANGQ